MDRSDMATKSENADIAVLQSQMETVISGVDGINKKLDGQAQTFVPKGEFEEFKKRWMLSHVIVGFVSAVLTGLTVYFISRGGA
jgi:hypothetical protein